VTEVSARTYRVTVRGRFEEQEPNVKARLVREVEDHDIFKSSFSTEGSFTYDHKIDFFNFRIEVHTSEGSDVAGKIGLAETETFLSILGIIHKGLKVNVFDASAVWE